MVWKQILSLTIIHCSFKCYLVLIWRKKLTQVWNNLRVNRWQIIIIIIFFLFLWTVLFWFCHDKCFVSVLIQKLRKSKVQHAIHCYITLLQSVLGKVTFKKSCIAILCYSIKKLLIALLGYFLWKVMHCYFFIFVCHLGWACFYFYLFFYNCKGPFTPKVKWVSLCENTVTCITCLKKQLWYFIVHLKVMHCFTSYLKKVTWTCNSCYLTMCNPALVTIHWYINKSKYIFVV